MKVPTKTVPLSHKNGYIQAHPQHKALAAKCSAFTLFKAQKSDAVKNDLKKKGLKASGPEISQAVSKLWATTDAATKAKLEAEANVARAELSALIKAWRKSSRPRKVAGKTLVLPSGWALIGKTDTQRGYYLNEDLEIGSFTRPMDKADLLKVLNKPKGVKKPKTTKPNGVGK
jgi:hypothetical protein